ncbi:AraC family transcriptional regulator [Puteibacter caeruleilacunae]|nr:AraC family transcriptional regulator [Puteibacter caeruleilacunae]
MQAQYFRLPQQPHQSIAIRKDTRPYFHDNWHYHSQLELVYIIKGEGTRFIGDDISGFTSGDLVLLGSHLPHVWKSEESYFKEGSKRKVEAIVLHFPQDIGGNQLWDLPEMTHIKTMLEQSHLGIHFHLPEKHPIMKMLKKMVQQEPFELLLSLLSLLKKLSGLEQKSSISKVSFADHYQQHQSKRIDRIYDYILKNFDKEIKLESIAALSNMTPSSLCRFFKQKTRKSISEFINEVRIGFACKLLIEGNLSISEICFRCGYNNLSYFNRQFKKIIGLTPRNYQEKKNSFAQ